MGAFGERPVLEKQLINCLIIYELKKNAKNKNFSFFKSKTMISCWGSFHSFSSFLHTCAQSLVSILVSDAYKLTMYGYIIYFVRLVGCSLQLGFECFPSSLTSAWLLFQTSKEILLKKRNYLMYKSKNKNKKSEIEWLQLDFECYSFLWCFIYYPVSSKFYCAYWFPVIFFFSFEY